MSAPKSCKVATCDRPKRKGKHFCDWHWLARQSSDVQAAEARRRVQASPLVSHLPRVPKSEWPPGERWCAGCQSFVPLFYCSGSRCRACANSAAHAARLEKIYGIDAVEYDRIFRVQGGRCAICKNRPASIRFAVDHDHKTDEVRGILCKRCNHDLLGGSHDSIDLLWAALVYLIHPPAMRAPGWTPPVDLTLDTLRLHLAARERPAEPRRPDPVPAPF